MRKVIGIQRDERFSPNSVEKDLAILRAVVDFFNGELVPETAFSEYPVSLASDFLVFSMARLPQTLQYLTTLEQGGAIVINSPRGVKNCKRSCLCQMMEECNVPQPSAEGGNGYWLKRGDAAAQVRGDVCFCKDKAQLEQAKASFLARGVEDMVVQAHVKGDLVKFYGVEPEHYFAVFYPGDDGQFKFGDEEKNGKPNHYFFDKKKLKEYAEKLSSKVEVSIYGGDAIISPDGGLYIIDFNDWPSFSRCKESAAQAIQKMAQKLVK